MQIKLCGNKKKNKTMKQIYTLATIIMVSMILPQIMQAQNIFPANGSVGIGTTTPSASSIIEMTSTTKGMLIPRMTKTQRDAIEYPRHRLMIYQTTNGPGFYYFDGGVWKAIAPAGVNKTLSNLAGPTAVNTDLLPDSTAFLNLGSPEAPWANLIISNGIFLNGNKFISGPEPDNTFVGKYSCEQTTGSRNTGMGSSALTHNTSGDDNTASGYSSLYANTTGYQNSAFGVNTLAANTVGSLNTAVGSAALLANTDGTTNSALGAYSLALNTTGYNNVASGAYALYSNTSGSHNSANGFKALYSNTTGYYNSAVGLNAMYTNTTGFSNTALGENALYLNKFGNYNTATGSEALYSNTGSQNTATGFGALYANTSATQNTANGYKVLYLNTTGAQNTAIGMSALSNNATGSYNTAGGRYALLFNDAGYENTAFGADAGSNAHANNYCSFFGYDADQAANTNFINSTAIGSTSRITANNQVRIGNSNVTSIGGYTNWSNISDGRFKKNIKENVPGLAFINKLKAVTYNLDITSLRKFVGEDVSYDKDGKKVSAEPDEQIRQATQKKQAIIQTGFVAQEVEKAAKELGYDFSGIDKPENENSPYGLRYSEFVVPLVKAVQELSKMNDEKNVKIDNLQKQIDELKTMMNAKQSVMSDELSVNNATQSRGELSFASLSQNIPNPFNRATIINYTLPEKFANAQIIITDYTGKTIKAVNVSGSGKGSLTIDASALTSGAYNYSLYVSGKLIDAKHMILTK